MPQFSEKKSEQILVMVVPAMFRELKTIAARHDRALGYVARELMTRGLGLYRADGSLKAVEAPHTQPAAIFDLEGEIRDGKRPEVIMSNWLIHEGKQPPADYGLLMFGGWETMSENERADAMRDAKKVLDRNLPPAGGSPAEVKAFPVAADAPLRREIQQQIDAVPLKPPKRRTKK